MMLWLEKVVRIQKTKPRNLLSLRFSELEPIFDTDYDENLFNYDANRPDLRPVPIDAVGY